MRRDIKDNLFWRVGEGGLGVDTLTLLFYHAPTLLAVVANQWGNEVENREISSVLQPLVCCCCCFWGADVCSQTGAKTLGGATFLNMKRVPSLVSAESLPLLRSSFIVRMCENVWGCVRAAVNVWTVSTNTRAQLHSPFLGPRIGLHPRREGSEGFAVEWKPKSIQAALSFLLWHNSRCKIGKLWSRNIANGHISDGTWWCKFHTCRLFINIVNLNPGSCLETFSCFYSSIYQENENVLEARNPSPLN